MIVENIIETKIIDRLIKYFEFECKFDIGFSPKHQLTMGMEKVIDPWSIPMVRDLLDPTISHYIDTSDNVGDTFFKHTDPYFPHADNNNEFDTVNVLIPLQRSHTQHNQYFIVFDQTNTQNSGATWMGEYDVPGEFQFNKKRTFPGRDTIVSGATSEDITEELYNIYLHAPNRPRELFYGLSINQAYDWVPGNMIMFNSDHIHCSGTMHCDWKLGLSLRFKGSLTDK